MKRMGLDEDLDTEITAHMVRKLDISPVKILKERSVTDIKLLSISPSKLAAIHKLSSPEKKALYNKLHEKGKVIDARAKETIQECD